MLVAALLFLPHVALRAYAVDVDRTPVAEYVRAGEPAEVVVVPGAAIRASGHPSGALATRIAAANALFETGAVGQIVGSGTPAEARLIAELASDPEPAQDPAGFSTHETCSNVAALGYEEVIVVTQQRHALRTGALCKMVGLDVTVVTTTPGPERTSRVPRRVLRERAAEVKAFAQLVVPFW